MEPDVSSPFLIISCVDSMLLWQSEFKRLAPSVNVVAYCGSKDGRKVARDLEFYGEDGSIKFHVLLSLPEFIVEVSFLYHFSLQMMILEIVILITGEMISIFSDLPGL